MQPISLREMQQIELDLLVEFDRVAKAHGLRYYLDGGTLLGAMCYEGFIPWDDDIDLKMPRPDYEKLRTLQDAFPAHIKLEFPRAGHCDYLFAKLTDDRTVLIEGAGNTRKVSGVYIDILPMDGHPAEAEECQRHLAALSRLNSLFHYSQSHFAAMKASASPITRLKGRVYDRLYTPWRLYRKLTRRAGQYPYDGAAAVGLVIEGDPRKERFEKSWLEPPVELLFEGRRFPAPNAYRQHMVIFYGEHVIKPECYHNLPRYPSNHTHEVYRKDTL